MVERTVLDACCYVCGHLISGPVTLHTDRGQAHPSCVNCSPAAEARIAELEAENARLRAERDQHIEQMEAVVKQAISRTGAVKVDELAQEIRRVDGSHSLGAGALAEALMPFLSALEPAAPEAFVYRDENGQPQVQLCKCDWKRVDDALVSCAGLLKTLCRDEIGDTAAAELEYVRSVITRPAEQAVTEAARVVLEWYERDGSVGGAVEPFEALKAAMEAGR